MSKMSTIDLLNALASTLTLLCTICFLMEPNIIERREVRVLLFVVKARPRSIQTSLVAYEVQTRLGSYFLTTASSSAEGRGVSSRSSEILSGQPVSRWISSTVTPGCRELRTI